VRQALVHELSSLASKTFHYTKLWLLRPFVHCSLVPEPAPGTQRTPTSAPKLGAPGDAAHAGEGTGQIVRVASETFHYGNLDPLSPLVSRTFLHGKL
jgi:hypothetical protein